VLTSVNHPHILRIYELLEDNVCFYIVSEVLSKGELFDHIVKSGRLEENYVISILKQILLALSHMHGQGIIHRDLKPENILMQDDLNIKLADFGFAVALKGKPQQLILGSPLYMAPEVIMGKDYGAAVDIWAVGVIACIMLTGAPPFFGKTKPEVQSAICY
jgi:serine/threonine protein kinase